MPKKNRPLFLILDPSDGSLDRSLLLVPIVRRDKADKPTRVSHPKTTNQLRLRPATTGVHNKRPAILLGVAASAQVRLFVPFYPHPPPCSVRTFSSPLLLVTRGNFAAFRDQRNKAAPKLNRVTVLGRTILEATNQRSNSNQDIRQTNQLRSCSTTRIQWRGSSLSRCSTLRQTSCTVLTSTLRGAGVRAAALEARFVLATRARQHWPLAESVSMPRTRR